MGQFSGERSYAAIRAGDLFAGSIWRSSGCPSSEEVGQDIGRHLLEARGGATNLSMAWSAPSRRSMRQASLPGQVFSVAAGFGAVVAPAQVAVGVPECAHDALHDDTASTRSRQSGASAGLNRPRCLAAFLVRVPPVQAVS
jgi:hypothetical protein